MNMQEYISNLEEKGRLFFNINDVTKVLKRKNTDILSSIYYFKKKGKLVSPLKGLYVILPTNAKSRGSLQPQDMIVIAMKHLKIPYYAALLTAASYHGASHQPPQVFQVVTNKRIRTPWKIGKVRIEFINKKDVEDTEIEQRIVSTGYLNVSSAEETAKDIMVFSEQSGGLNHQATVLSELIEEIEISKLIKVANKTSKRTWIQRMGYILSNIEPFDNNKRDKIVTVLSSFLKKNRFNYIPLAPEIDVEGYSRDSTWKIIENTTIESDI